MDLTTYHAKYFAHELTKRCPSDSVEKLAEALVDVQGDESVERINDDGAYYEDARSRLFQFGRFRFVALTEASKLRTRKSLGPGRSEEQRERHDDQVCDKETCLFCCDERLRKFGVY